MASMLDSGKSILQKLNDSGYEAYFVGGYVRDQLLGLESADIDITTNARPDEVEKLFDKTIPTGKRFGTMTVMVGKQGFEVTTYRIDQDYMNHRQPETVAFSNNLKEDLVRRDFTMNALVQDYDGEIIDIVGGIKDVSQRIIRAINDPQKRFKEDALRILRAIRFASKLNFKIEENTMNAMIEDAHLLKHISRERIINELVGILSQNYHYVAYKLLNEIKFDNVFPIFKNALNLLKTSSKKLSIESFFAIAAYPDLEVDQAFWRLSNKQYWIINELIHLMRVLVRQQVNPMIAYQHPKELVIQADELLSLYFGYSSQKQMIHENYNQLIIHSLQDLSINGQMIHSLVKDKKNVGRIIDSLVEAVLYHRIENSSNDLLEYAKNMAEALNETN